MSWRDNLIQASFRAVPFYVESHEYEVGRRNVAHQYPYKEVPYTEDLGLDADVFYIEGYVIANKSNNQDYFAARKALENAIKKEGPGKLSHPYLGEKNVIVYGKTRIKESIREGGIARFSMTFMIAGANKFPGEEVDPIGAVDASVEETTDMAMDTFHDQYSQTGQPGFSITGAYNDFSEYVSMSKQYVNLMRSAGPGTPALSDIKSTFDDARAVVLEATRYPCQIANAVVDCIDSVLNAANIISTGYIGKIIGECSERVIEERLSDTGDKVTTLFSTSMVSAFTGIAGKSTSTGFGADPTVSTSLGGTLAPITVATAVRARQAANRIAMVNMIKAMNIGGAARVAIRTDYESLDQSNAQQEAIIDSLDYLLLKLGDESASDPYGDYGIYVDNADLYGKLEDLRGTLIKSMRLNALNLAKEIIYETPPDGTTSLKLSYNLYNDLDRENEIFLRNQPTIKHPGFLNGDIKVLSE